MKRVAAALTLLLVLGILLVAVAPLALAASIDPVAPDPDAGRADAPITWTLPLVEVAVGAGETVQAAASFTSAVNLARAELVVSFPLGRYVRVTPTGRFPVVAGTAYPVNLAITLPAADAYAALPVVAGTVQVVAEGRFLSRPLMVTITRKMQPPPITWTPDRVQLQVSLPSTSAAAEALPPSTARVGFSSLIAIVGARLRATAPLNMVLDVVPVGPLDVRPGLSYAVGLTAHAPPVTTIRDAGDGQTRRIISGQVEIYNGSQVFARSLPVTVILEPAAPPAVIVWRPAEAMFVLDAGRSASRVVTGTSNLALDNATLKVTGPITPYLTVSPSPLSFPANTPVPVTLQATAPSPFARPVAGSVVVVDSAGRALSRAIEVVLAPQPQPEPAHINWRPSEVSFRLNEEESASRVVTATSDLPLNNATLRVTGPITPYLTVSPSPLSFLPATPVQVTLFVTAPVAPFERPVGGEVVVVDSTGRVLRDVLEVSIHPAFAGPVISWSPPVVTFALEATSAATARRTVTVTSSVTVENATLKVTGAITPYLHVVPQTLTLFPGQPQQVVLGVISPAIPVYNRPLAGEVVLVDSAGHILRHELKVMIMWQRPRSGN
jgi:hypothetical protein